jgi:hypothetical protein
MDHGTLTDNNGRKADFRHVVIVMTTNAGAAEMSRASIGFVSQDHATDGMEAIKRLFAPEFRNRIDAIVSFDALDAITIQRVVDKLLVEVETQLEQKGVALHIDDAARQWIAQRGYDPKMGARPMARVIQEHIKRPLAEELLFGRLEKGGHAFVGVALDGTLKIEVRSTEEPALLLPQRVRAPEEQAARHHVLEPVGARGRRLEREVIEGTRIVVVLLAREPVFHEVIRERLSQLPFVFDNQHGVHVCFASLGRESSNMVVAPSRS